MSVRENTPAGDKTSRDDSTGSHLKQEVDPAETSGCHPLGASACDTVTTTWEGCFVDTPPTEVLRTAKPSDARTVDELVADDIRSEALSRVAGRVLRS